MQYESVIGLEVHAQLLTKSKIFCGCPTAFGAEANHHTCPVCLGLPGVLPVLNKKVVDFAVRAALATKCSITHSSRWARKNYFYPDLPKGYQISMFDLPIAEHGYVEVDGNGSIKKIGLTRIHMEEDAGKSIHDAERDSSLVDLNRTGIPLLEIVSEPDIRSAEEAGVYLRNLRSILQYLGICDGNMEEGSLRCDANVSVRRVGTESLGTRTETKNLNSFKAVEKAIRYETQRQIGVVESGERVVQETRLWDSEREITRTMRSKELAHDYRYFPDPDLMPLVVDDHWIARERESIPELPSVRRERFVRHYGLPPYDAEILTARRDVADYFEAAVVSCPDEAKLVSNWVMDVALRFIKEEKLDATLKIREWPCPPEHIGRLVSLIKNEVISGTIAKTVFSEMRKNQLSPEDIVEKNGLRQVSDRGALEAQVEAVLAENPDKVQAFLAGKEKLIGFFVGHVMRATGGKANPRMVNELALKKLETLR